MKKISIISICLLIFVVAISCASAADYDADAANDTTIDNMTNIEEVDDIDLNISSDESPALDIEPLENDVPNSSSIKNDTLNLDIKGPNLDGVSFDNIPGPKQPTANSHDDASLPEDRENEIIAGIVIAAAGTFTANPICIACAVALLFDWF